MGSSLAKTMEESWVRMKWSAAARVRDAVARRKRDETREGPEINIVQDERLRLANATAYGPERRTL